MASLPGVVNGIKYMASGWNQAGVWRKTAGFHKWKMRMKMNKLSNKPKLVGRDEFGNNYFEDTTESFGRNRWVEYARPNKFASGGPAGLGPDTKGAHDGTTDHGFDASQVGPQWHGWLHYMSDETPGTLTGYDGKVSSCKRRERERDRQTDRQTDRDRKNRKCSDNLCVIASWICHAPGPICGYG